MERTDYFTGFGSYFQSEALPNSLPPRQNSPQHPAHGLYPEQINGSAFTAPRTQNLATWFYRINPSVKHHEFSFYGHSAFPSANIYFNPLPPNQMRWDPLPYSANIVDFIDGLHLYAGLGDPAHQSGAQIYLYACQKSMGERYFFNSDGDLLLVPQEGGLTILTELGIIEAEPKEIVLIPRGIKFRIDLKSDFARGYVLENFGRPFILPDRGPIGANGLANNRDFLVPKAAFEDQKGHFKLLTKFNNTFWQCDIEHCPLDVVAWHGNYVPFKYDLTCFNTIGSISYDHPDPSIFTVLTSPSELPGTANVDFVIFPERWMVAQHTFRPPYYHRNTMSEFMGLIYGAYDAKEKGFLPAGASLHNCMSAHGPDYNAFIKATEHDLKPEYYAGTLAFMFESRLPWQVSHWAYESKLRQRDYLKCWQSLPRLFPKK